MSVGLQRLRDEPERIRQGAIDKGEDPSIVDAALAVDARRRELQGEGDALRGERNAVSRQVGEAIKGGAAPGGGDVAALKQRSSAIGERLAALDSELAASEADLEELMLRIPNPADPDVPVGGEEANVTVRTWGELLP
jgi:seryl-tRNA synthetase